MIRWENMQPVTNLVLYVLTGWGQRWVLCLTNIIRDTDTMVLALLKEGFCTPGGDYSNQENEEYFISMPELPFSNPLSPEAFQSIIKPVAL